MIPVTCAVLFAGQPEMTRAVKVGETKCMCKYFTYLCPSKRSSCTITSMPSVVTSATSFLHPGCSIFTNQSITGYDCLFNNAHGCPHAILRVPTSSPKHPMTRTNESMHQVARKLYHNCKQRMFGAAKV